MVFLVAQKRDILRHTSDARPDEIIKAAVQRPLGTIGIIDIKRNGIHVKATNAKIHEDTAPQEDRFTS